MDWYLLQTKPNAHTIAFSHLKRQGYEVFLPLLLKTFKKSGKFESKTVPLFPGYIFVGIKIDRVSWKSINATRGIAKAVTLDGNYRPVSRDIIEGIKCRCDKDGVLQKMNNIESGDRVKIERGPFTDFICNVEKVLDGQRALVLPTSWKDQPTLKLHFVTCRRSTNQCLLKP